LIKHLLILREQISPFRVDFAITEKTLDFSHIKDVVTGIFSGGKLAFFIDLVQKSGPRVLDFTTDSRKGMEKELKSACESFIATHTQSLIGPLLAFFNKMAESKSAKGTSDNKKELLNIVNSLVRDSSSNCPFESNVSRLLSTTALYLSNPMTEKILLKPIQVF